MPLGDEMDISVVIPVYGCREALPELHQRLTEALSKMVSTYEIILVNDACPQGSWTVIEELCRKDSHVVGLELSRNFGQLRATTAGLDYSSGDWVIVMDCDLQDRPEEIPRLYAKALEGYDVVIARRKKRQDSKLKIMVSNAFYAVYGFATGQPYDGSLCNFSVSSRQVIDNYCRMRERHRGFIMYIQWMGFREAILDVEHQERFAGESGYSFKKRIDLALELLTSQSDKLLRLTVKIGLAISACSLLVIIYLLIRYFALNIQAGWTSTIAAIFLMGGLVIASIGVVGIYVGNIFMEVKHRPLYIIRQCLNGREKDSEDRP